MTNLVTDISIENFKSIAHCRLEGCKRINLLIGRPDGGRSNMLEALSVFSLPFLKENTDRKITRFIRAEHPAQLFYNGDIEREIKIQTNKGSLKIGYDQNESLRVNIMDTPGGGNYIIDDKLNFILGKNQEYLPIIRKYTFVSENNFRRSHSRYLIPPYGPNLLDMIEQHPILKDEVSDLLALYGLSLVFEKVSVFFKVMHVDNNKKGFLLPYHSMAGTLQRIIFYKTAIATNENAVLLFEEPEAHLFPSCIISIAQEMICKKNNQFFVATHSSVILHEILKHDVGKLAVFIFSYGFKGINCRKLADEELVEIDQHGVDLIVNSESYI